jgi:hypothetical protein
MDPSPTNSLSSTRNLLSQMPYKDYCEINMLPKCPASSVERFSTGSIVCQLGV